MARPFDIGGPDTALRLYLILICCAARGETVTYEELAQRAHQQDKGLLAMTVLMSEIAKGSSTERKAVRNCARRLRIPVVSSSSGITH
jgi:hypothetical protein